MKLKIYRISLMLFLFISFVITLIFGILSTMSIIGIEQDKIMDGIMYILCFCLLLIFTGLQIANTIVSFKNGSSFIVNLAYNDNKTVNKNFLLILGGVSALSIFSIIYFSFIYNGFDLPFSGFDKNISSFIICVSVLLLINSIYIILFPILAKEDISLQKDIKNNK